MGIKGAILGDIIGSRFEFSGCTNPWSVPLFTDKNFFTDDTILSCATKYAVDTGIEFLTAYKLFGDRYLNYQGAGWGNNFLNFILDNGYHRQSFGNGSAMRVSYIGERAVNEESCVSVAELSAKTTHDTVEGVKAAQATSLFVHIAKHCMLHDAKRIILDLADDMYSEYKGFVLTDYRRFYKWSELAKDSVHLAAVCACSANSFEECMRNVLSVDCDTDTIGAIAGGIAEELFGIDGFEKYLEQYLDDYLYRLICH